MKIYNSLELHNIIERLVGGYINPVGVTEYDNEAYTRQKTIQGLIDLLIGDIDEVADCVGREASIEKARNEAVKWMNNQKDYLEEILENVIEDEGAAENE